MSIKMHGGKFAGGFYGKFDGYKNIISLALYMDPTIAQKDGSDNLTTWQDKSFNNFTVKPIVSAIAPKIKTFRGFPVLECDTSGMAATIAPFTVALDKLKFLSDGSPYSIFSIDYIETTNPTGGTFWGLLQTRITSALLTGLRAIIGLRSVGANGRFIQGLTYNGATNVATVGSGNASYLAAGECFITEWLCRGYSHAGNDMEIFKNGVSLATLAAYSGAPDSGNPIRASLYQLSGTNAICRNFILLAYNWTGKTDSLRDSDRAMVMSMLQAEFGSAIY